MNHYFTISQFARLRGVDINSLRYYERLGILKPAYTDPDTHYRYYDAEQLYMLDTILLCVNLGIPLKQLSTYTDENGNYQNQALFKEGQRRARGKDAGTPRQHALHRPHAEVAIIVSTVVIAYFIQTVSAEISALLDLEH